jgi:hypothetical protein
MGRCANNHDKPGGVVISLGGTMLMAAKRRQNLESSISAMPTALVAVDSEWPARCARGPVDSIVPQGALRALVVD